MIAQIVDYTALAVLIAAIPAAGWSAWRHRRAARRVDLSLLWRPFAAVALTLLLSYYTAIDQGRAALRLLIWLAYLAIFYIARHAPRRWVMTGLRAMGWLVAVVTLIEALAIDQGRAGSWLMGNPNKVGGLLAVLLPLSSRFSWMLIGWAALLAVDSRGAIVGVLASALVGREQRIVVVILVALLAITGLAMMRPSTVATRLNTWREAASLFRARPVMGWGAGCYPLLAAYEPDHPHADSWPLTIAAEQGLIGLAAWGWLAVEVARLAARSESRARLGLLAFAVHNLVDVTLWWWWIGISVMMLLAMLEIPDD